MDSGPLKIHEIYDVGCAMLYAKALDGAVFEVHIPGNGTYHQTTFIPIPEYLKQKMPENTIYGIGQSVGLGSGRNGCKIAGIPYLHQWLPTRKTITLEV